MRVGLIGDPLGHSFSPRLHAAFGTADYELHPIPAEALPAFFRERAFEGVNPPPRNAERSTPSSTAAGNSWATTPTSSG